MVKTKLVKNKKFYKAMALLAEDPLVKVGVLQERGSEKEHEDSDGLTVAAVATFHEFGGELEDGTPNPPRRSFIQATARKYRQKINQAKVRILRQIHAGQISVEQGLGVLGEYITGLMKKEIRAGIAPPNAPATIAAKGSSTPLIDKGQLIGAIWYSVKMDGVAEGDDSIRVGE